MDSETTVITPDQLIGYINDKKKLLLVDLRSFLNYAQCHIQSSINVSVPSTLVKRDNFCLSKLESVITCTQMRQKFKEREGVDVVLYDNECDKGKSPMFSCLLKKFAEEHVAKSVSYLQGGFTGLMKTYPSYCSTKTPSPCSSVKLPCLSAGKLDMDDVEANKILDYLYMGTQGTASNLDILQKNGITHILNTAVEVPNFFETCSRFSYKKLNLVDAPSQCIDIETLNEAFNFIEDAKAKGEKVLVHCRAGQSRSASIVIAYIMWSFHWPLTKAYSFVQEKRPVVSPNLGFIAQLAQLDAKWNTVPSVTVTTTESTKTSTPHQSFFPVDQIPACT